MGQGSGSVALLCAKATASLMTDGIDGVTNVGCSEGSALILNVIMVMSLGGVGVFCSSLSGGGTGAVTSKGEYARLHELDWDVLEVTLLALPLGVIGAGLALRWSTLTFLAVCSSRL
jgi:hypothetical protein